MVDHRVTPGTKAFKEWDKQFKAAELRIERQIWLGNDRITGLEDRWINKVESWDMKFIRFCVYEADDVENWQRFRVALKGLSTHEKLLMLRRRFEKYKDSIHVTSQGYPFARVEKCRVDNYLGALVRGGQLNSDHEIVR